MLISKIKFNINFFQYLLILILLPSLITGPFLPNCICVLLGLIFVFDLYKKSKFNFSNNKILIAYILFTFILIISSLFSEYSASSLKISLLYFRFILFALGFYLVCKKNLKCINLFFLASTITIIFLAVNNIIQYFFKIDLFGNIPIASDHGRYSSLFGDWLVAGSYLARFASLGFIYVLFSSCLKKYRNIYFILYFLILMLGVCVSGERTSFVMIIMNIIISTLFLVNFRKIIFISLLCFVTLTFFTIKVNPSIESRMFETTKNQIFENHKINFFSKEHQSHYLVAYNMFKNKPFLGYGAGSFRYACKEDSYIKYNGCTTHPHNLYIQFLAEIGVAGFFFLAIFDFFICYRFIKIILKKKKNEVDLIKLFLYTTVIVNLFPLMPSGNFFNSWLSIVMYIPLALILFFENLNMDQQKILIKNFE